MTKAEKIANEGKAPAYLADAVEDVKASAQRVADGIKQATRTGELRNRVHADHIRKRLLKAAESGEELKGEDRKLAAAMEGGEITEGNAREFSGLTHDQAGELMKEVAEDWLANTCYAYRFERLDDDSVLAIYVLEAGGEVGFKAFEDVEATVGWHPTRNPEGN